MIVHQKSFRGPPADMEFPFTETLAAPKDGAIHHKVHAQSGVVAAPTLRYWVGSRKNPGKTGHFRSI
jgi:hypothetical protein